MATLNCALSIATYHKTIVISVLTSHRIGNKNGFNSLFRESLNKFNKPNNFILNWDNISGKTENLFIEMIRVFNMDDDSKIYILNVPYTNGPRNISVLKAILVLMSKIANENQGELLRLYIKEENTKVYKSSQLLKDLRSILERTILDVDLQKIPYGESKMLQMANIFAEAYLYFEKDDLYFKNLGAEGKPSVVSYILGMKTIKNKILLVK